MKPPTPEPPAKPPASGEPAAAAGDEAATGLPWFRTWHGVYLLVLAAFAAYIALLVAFGRHFSA